MLWLLAVLVCAHAGEAAPAAPVRAPVVKNLSDQFPDPPERQQCEVGSCHAFAGVAVLEAAYFRAYKEHVRFSEADVFFRNTVLKEKYRTALRPGEGGSTLEDVKFAIENGVLAGGDYVTFVERYLEWKGKRMAEGAEAYSRSEARSKLANFIHDPRRQWLRRQNRKRMEDLYAEMLLSSDVEELEKQRGLYKAKLGALKAHELSGYVETGFGGFGDPGPECEKKGAVHGMTIKKELDAGRPVAVGMALHTVEGWGGNWFHAFAITGYRSDGSLLTRNSAGGNNPDVLPDQLCFLRQIVTVLAPGESL